MTRQGAFNLGGVSEENWIRIQEQNEKPISVIIGNPPYNAAQRNFNEFNPNRKYPHIDQRIKETYTATSTAQNNNNQNDMYKRFIRWASDRLDDDGIIGFITNRSYIDKRQDDGFRRITFEEFTDVYILDLGSDVRRNPNISGTTHNVFGIQTGVAIVFFVRQKTKLGQCQIHYAMREDEELARNKLDFLREANLESIEFDAITPDTRSQWTNQSKSNFKSLLPLANRQTKVATNVQEECAVFRLFSNGVKTQRDEWAYDDDTTKLKAKISYLIETYEEKRLLLATKTFETSELGTEIKWDRELRKYLARNQPLELIPGNIVKCIYRPFTEKYLYFQRELNAMRYQIPRIYPDGKPGTNKVICFVAPSAPDHFYILATNKVFDLHFTGDSQGLPLYRYTAAGERVCNITDWGIRQFNDHYREEWGDAFEKLAGPDGITAEHIFAYTYAVLHDPMYREDYRVDLLRDFPRLPFYHEFEVWKEMGQDLLDLHIGFEEAKPYPLERVDLKKNPKQVSLRANKAAGSIVLDDKTTLLGIPPGAWEYQLGSRSALEWVLDQYKEKKPKDPTIAEHFNTYRFADYKERVIDLLQRVCTVSVNTMEIVDRMASIGQVQTSGKPNE